MRAAAQSDYVSVEDSLAAEAASDIRYEYPGGLVYAMAALDSLDVKLHCRPSAKVFDYVAI